MCLDQGQELVLGSAHQLPDLLPILVHLEGGHGRDARRGRHFLVLVDVNLNGLSGWVGMLGEMVLVQQEKLVIRRKSNDML